MMWSIVWIKQMPSSELSWMLFVVCFLKLWMLSVSWNGKFERSKKNCNYETACSLRRSFFYACFMVLIAKLGAHGKMCYRASSASLGGLWILIKTDSLCCVWFWDRFIRELTSWRYMMAAIRALSNLASGLTVIDWVFYSLCDGFSCKYRCLFDVKIHLGISQTPFISMYWLMRISDVLCTRGLFCEKS